MVDAEKVKGVRVDREELVLRQHGSPGTLDAVVAPFLFHL
jgi:hypothetical protein